MQQYANESQGRLNLHHTMLDLGHGSLLQIDHNAILDAQITRQNLAQQLILNGYTAMSENAGISPTGTNLSMHFY